MKIIKVLFLAAEAGPFIKIGGLADISFSLPAALNNLASQNTPKDISIDIRLAIPYHGEIHSKSFALKPAAEMYVNHKNGPIKAQALTTQMAGLSVYLISGKPIPADAPVYTNDEYADGRKYTFFSLAALEMIKTTGWTPDIIHANDWHTSPAIYALKNLYPGLKNVAALIGVHNLPYLGSGTSKALEEFGLLPAKSSSLPRWAQHLPLPLALLASDHIVTVSPSYAEEILTPKYGSGLHKFLQSRSDVLTGILNGINQDLWDPARDPAIPFNFNKDTLNNRHRNKLALQKELGLEINKDTLLLAAVSRLDPQKGIDLIPQAFHKITQSSQAEQFPWQFILLGTGSTQIEKEMLKLEQEYPERVRTVFRFDSNLSRLIFAGADALVIPSRYEPSGLTQMIAMRYGCVPVARATGGLLDTIDNFRPSKHSTGFLFKNPSAQDLSQALHKALRVFRKKQVWRQLQIYGMQSDFSWEKSARKYLDLYISMINNK